MVLVFRIKPMYYGRLKEKVRKGYSAKEYVCGPFVYLIVSYHFSATVDEFELVCSGVQAEDDTLTDLQRILLKNLREGNNFDLAKLRPRP